MNNYKFVVVDFQKDFSSQEWKAYRPRSSIDFVKKTLVPFFRKNTIKVAEIISDYRAPRSWSTRICNPWDEGFESEIPNDIKLDDVRIKAMNSPLWTRENAGIAHEDPGIPFQDAPWFTAWLENSIGQPEDDNKIVLFWLTLDCCVLSTAQELSWRGYNVYILEDWVDTYSGDEKEKTRILNHVPLKNRSKIISFEEL